MRVIARAVIMRDDKLLVSHERRRGREYVLLPGGRVEDGESITEALIRELGEETGLEIIPERLLYVAEVVGAYGAHDLNLVWLAQLGHPDAAIDERALVALDSAAAQAMRPPILEQIVADAQNGWPEEPRWLGNIRRPALD